MKTKAVKNTKTAVVPEEKGHGNRNLHEICMFHIKTKRFLGGLCKLEKDGSLSKINGQIFSIKTTKNGEALVIIDNLLGKKRSNATKRWQAVLMKNLVCLHEHGWEHRKIG